MGTCQEWHLTGLDIWGYCHTISKGMQESHVNLGKSYSICARLASDR